MVHAVPITNLPKPRKREFQRVKVRKLGERLAAQVSGDHGLRDARAPRDALLGHGPHCFTKLYGKVHGNINYRQDNIDSSIRGNIGKAIGEAMSTAVASGVKKTSSSPFAQQLLAEMRRQNVTQAALAKKTGVSQPTISAVLSGATKDPSRRVMVTLGRALGLSDEYLGRQIVELEPIEDALARVLEPLEVLPSARAPKRSRSTGASSPKMHDETTADVRRMCLKMIRDVEAAVRPLIREMRRLSSALGEHQKMLDAKPATRQTTRKRTRKSTTRRTAQMK